MLVAAAAALALGMQLLYVTLTLAAKSSTTSGDCKESLHWSRAIEANCSFLHKPINANVRPLQQHFSANSGLDFRMPELWVAGAASMLPALNELSVLSHKTSLVEEVQVKHAGDFAADAATHLTLRLGKLFNFYGSDKDRHGYTPLYGHVLQRLRVKPNLNTLEIGLGTKTATVPSSMARTPGTHPGSSLRAFRDALPSATIHGADIDPAVLFSEPRIFTGVVDQLVPSSFFQLHQKFGNVLFDLIIDDGLHSAGANLNTLAFGLRALRQGGWIVIEDLDPRVLPSMALADQVLRSGKRSFETFFFNCSKNLDKSLTSQMYVVHSL